MRWLARLVFWIGTVSLAYGVILRFAIWMSGEQYFWPFGLQPGNFLEFSFVCFTGAIAYTVIYIFETKKY